jgi:queuine tRNA-ribosyltransferase
MMVLDDCLAFPASHTDAEKSMVRSMQWAERALSHFNKTCANRQALFGIVQGGVYPDLRQESARRLIEMAFPGYAIGGLAVGEPNAQMYEIVGRVEEHLPADRPRYLMGVGTPADLVECVALGIDMFDCVMPTRHARNGWLFTPAGHLVIRHSRYKDDSRPIDESCECPVCRTYTRAYLRHLFLANEILSSILNTVHNLFFYLDTMRRIRQFIELHRFAEFLTDWRRRQQAIPLEPRGDS